MSLKYTSIPSKTLAASITAASTSLRINNIKGWDGVDLTAADFGSTVYGVLRNPNNTLLEIFEYDPATIADANITITRRGLKFNGDLTTEVEANKYAWTKGDTQVDLGVDTPQMLQTLQTAFDNAIVAGGVPASTSVIGLNRMSVAPVDPAVPTAVGDNDPRVPTATQTQFISATTGMISMYAGAAAPTGFLFCDGAAVSRTTFAALFAIASTTYGVGDGSTTFNVPDLRSSFPVGQGQKTKAFTFLDANVNVATEVITVPTNEYLYTGQQVALTTSGVLPAGLSATNYFIIRVTATTIKLATSRANADDDVAVNITAAAGGGTHTLTLTLTNRVIGTDGGEESHTLQTEELASHIHDTAARFSGGSGSNQNIAGSGSATNASLNTSASGGDTPHNNMPPFVSLHFIIKT